MIKLGMLIGDRYEILDKIGTGGMSDVYKAKDQKLNRFVAVKVLKQEFSENKNFVSKLKNIYTDININENNGKFCRYRF